MNELYLIGRFGAIHELMVVLTIISSIVTFIAIFDLITKDEGTKIPKGFTKFPEITITTLIISVIGLITIPSKRELYFIFGVGTAIDYV